MNAGRVRALSVGAIAVVSCGLLFGSVVPSAAGAAAPEPTVGNSYAQTLQLDPRTAGLSYQMTFGAALANHQNTVARAQAQTANAGVIGTALVAPGCNGADPAISPDTLPTPVKVDSREDGAAEGVTEHNGPWEQTARASQAPYAESYTKLAPFSLGGIVNFLGGIAKSTSGLDRTGKTLTSADTQIAGIEILNGLVRLEGLHWRSASRPGQVDPSTTFSIESVKIAGVAAPDAPALSLLDSANLVLLPLGIQIGIPKIHTDNGTTFVDPIRIAIVPSEIRDQVVSQITDAIQPLREQFFGFIIDGFPCEYNPSAAILVADILTLSVTGGGSFGVNFGGTQAVARKFEGATLPNSFVPGAANVGGGSAATGTGTGAVDFGGGSSAGGAIPPLTDLDTSGGGGDSAGGARRALPASDTDENDNAMWVAIAVIGLGLVLVEGELRLRRRAKAAEVAS